MVNKRVYSKYLIFIFLLLFAVTSSYSVYSQNDLYHSPYKLLEKDKVYHLFGDNVKFRKLPKLDSEVISVLRIGDEVKIIGKSDEFISYNGIDYPFYKVKYEGQEGFISGGLISVDHKKNNNINFVFSLRKENDQYKILIRAFDSIDLQYTEFMESLVTNDFQLKLSGNKGISGIDNILYLDYIAEACGVQGGGIYYFIIGKELKKVFEISQISDAGVFWYSEELLFPTDEGGKDDAIIYRSESGSYKDEATNWTEIVTVNRELKYKDGEILPKINENHN